MKTKKILSLVMAIAMALSLAVTALADDLDAAPDAAAATDLEHAAQYTGNTAVPTINLVVTGTNSVMAFNPYKLGVKVDANGVPDSSGTATANDQFITKEITITNLTNVPLKLEGSLKVTPYVDDTLSPPDGAQAATLSNKAIAATETAKKLYVYADFYAFDAAYATVPDRTKTAAAAQRLVAATAGTAVTHAATSRVLMQASDGTNANYVYVKVNGEATTVPTEAWGAYDRVQIDLVFKFQSQPNPDKFAIVEKADSADITVVPAFSNTNAKVDKATSGTDLCAGVAANGVAGSVYFITPASGKKITAVKFYDKTGTTAITTVKAATTDSKVPTAPWSFTMPADNVVMEVTLAAVT